MSTQEIRKNLIEIGFRFEVVMSMSDSDIVKTSRMQSYEDLCGFMDGFDY